MLAQQLQPLSPFPMGDSPVLGTGYRAPQNTPAACTASHPCGSAIHASGVLSPGVPWDSVGGTLRLVREQGAAVASSPAEAPGVQDLLAAFRRAAGQERLPASPVLAPAGAASGPAAGVHADAPQASSAPADPPAQPVSSPPNANLDACNLPGAAEAQAGADAQEGNVSYEAMSDTPTAHGTAHEGGAMSGASPTRGEPADGAEVLPASAQEPGSEECQTAAAAEVAKEDHTLEVYDEATKLQASSERLQAAPETEATCQAGGGVLEAQSAASVTKASGTAESLHSTASTEAAGSREAHGAAQPKMSQNGLSENVNTTAEPQSSPKTSPR